jgi:glutamate/tyrosine decarboxylase-like PLP-dependent enzyme
LKRAANNARADVDFAEKLVPKILDYLRGSASDSAAVVKLADPAEIGAVMQSDAGLSLQIDADQAPEDVEALLRAADVVCDYSVRTGSPGFNNQLYGAVDAVGIAGDWLSSALNTNVHTYEAAPMFTLLEQAVVHKLAGALGDGFLGDGKPNGFELGSQGLLLAGGSMANLYGMQLARHWKVPETKEHGNTAAKYPLLAFTSAESHYSYLKGANLMGLGTASLVKVPCDPRTGAMDVAALDALLTAEASKPDDDPTKRLPFFVGATAGTTVLGAFDPFEEIAAVCARHGVWLHVDGAWGGGALFSKKLRANVAGVEKSDSFCWNPHKILGAPLQTTLFAVNSLRHRDILRSANSANAGYLFQPDKNFGELDIGDTTMQCGRRADALKLWMMWKLLGDEGVERRIDHCVDLIDYMNERAVSTTDGQGRRCFRVVKHAFANLCFYVIPPSHRDAIHALALPADDEDDGLVLSRLTAEQRASLGKVAPVIKDRMQRQGKALIGFQPVNQQFEGQEPVTFRNCWRMVIAGSREETMQEEQIDQILQDMLDLSEDL